MTNPSNAVGTNGAYGGRTSVDALNDVLGAFNGSGVLCGWVVRADSGMGVLVGGQSGSRDVAVAQDQLGDKTTVNNRLGSPISVTIAEANPNSTRVDSIVLYVNKPATVLTTTIDNPEACGIIAVQGTTTAPSSADIRAAITADGGTGATAYYVVIADITIPASATVITDSNITNYSGKLLGSGMIADGAITTNKIADDAITTGKIANGAVTNNKISWSSATYEPSYTLGTGFTRDRGGVWRCGNVICVNMVLKCTQTQSGNVSAITVSGVTFNQANNSGFVVYEGTQYSMTTAKNGYAFYSALNIQGVTADKYYLVQFVGIATS